MGNEMAYLWVPRGDMERYRETERESNTKQRQQEGQRERVGDSIRRRQRERHTLYVCSYSLCVPLTKHSI